MGTNDYSKLLANGQRFRAAPREAIAGIAMWATSQAISGGAMATTASTHPDLAKVTQQSVRWLDGAALAQFTPIASPVHAPEAPTVPWDSDRLRVTAVAADQRLA
jgi:hypothetical protein